MARESLARQARRGWLAAGVSGTAVLAIAAFAVAAGSQADASAQSAAVVTVTPTGSPSPTPTAPPTSPAPTATPTPTPTDVGRSPLLPNLRARRAADIHLVLRGSQRRLMFASVLVNRGAGPLEVVRRGAGACPTGQRRVDQAVYQDRNGNGRFNRASDVKKVFRPSGCEIVTPGEDTWHVDASARYWLTQAGHTAVIVRRPKVSFCLRDSLRLESATAGAYYPHCSRNGRKGISIGWGDLYQSFFPGQSMKLPAQVKGHTYCLWQQADPRDLFTESNEDDNISVRAIRITLHNHVRYLATNARCTSP